MMEHKDGEIHKRTRRADCTPLQNRDRKSFQVPPHAVKTAMSALPGKRKLCTSGNSAQAEETLPIGTQDPSLTLPCSRICSKQLANCAPRSSNTCSTSCSAWGPDHECETM